MNLFIEFSKGSKSEVGNLKFSMDYIESVTEKWHTKVPETRKYVVCNSNEATHVIFSELDLQLARDDGKNLSANCVYPLKIEEYGDYLIIDDKGQEIIGFDCFIPCEYLKEKEEIEQIDNSNEIFPSNVVSLLDYRKRKGNVLYG